MKILIYSPYFPDHQGGGEKYLLDVAQVLAKKAEVVIGLGGDRNYTVSELAQIKEQYQQFLGSKLSVGIEFLNVPLGSSESFWKKLWWSRQWDAIYYATDGSLFFSLAKRNILHIQIPFTQPKKGLLERLKLLNWPVKNTNSNFTKQVVEKSWRTKVNLVHYPTWVEKQPVKLEQKEKIVLNVGRFFSHLHSKRQDLLVEMWAELLQKSPAARSWQLVLIGNVEDQKYLAKIEKLIKSKGLEKKILIKNKVTRRELLAWYTRSSIYWHATGFGVDQDQHPEKVEHFGITTLEAMSYGCVPVVINKGGQPEVLGSDLKNLLWDTPGEGVLITADLIKDPAQRQKLQTPITKQVEKFSRSRFEQALWLMFKA